MTAEELKQIFGRAVPDRGKLQEIRLRAGKPVLVFMDGREYMVGREGLLEPDADLSPVLADPALIREILGIFSRHSLYAFEDEIRQGFLTIEGGHRVGIAGKAVTEGSRLRTIRDISSLNIRLAHEKPGCGDPVLPWLYENGRLQNTLILSPPGAGKTTLLRDVVRQVSNGNRYGPGLQTAVVDERSELGACFKGVPQCDLGMRTDVMDGCPKALGMVMMIRSMAPGAVAVDEIGDREDLEAETVKDALEHAGYDPRNYTYEIVSGIPGIRYPTAIVFNSEEKAEFIIPAEPSAARAFEGNWPTAAQNTDLLSASNEENDSSMPLYNYSDVARASRKAGLFGHGGIGITYPSGTFNWKTGAAAVGIFTVLVICLYSFVRSRKPGD